MKKSRSAPKRFNQKQKMLLLGLAAIFGITTLCLYTQKPKFISEQSSSAQKSTTTENQEYVKPSPIHYSSPELGISFDHEGSLFTSDIKPVKASPGLYTYPNNINHLGEYVMISGGEYTLPIYRYKDASSQKIATEIQRFYQPKISEARKYILDYAKTAESAETRERVLATVKLLDKNNAAGRYGAFKKTTFTDKNNKEFPAYEGTAVTAYHEYYLENFHERSYLIIQDGADVIVVDYWPGNMETALITLDSLELH